MGLLACFFMLGCSNQSVQVVEDEIVDREYEQEIVVESILEFKLETVDLHTLEPYEVMYTPYESDRYIQTDGNNFSLQINEYYNENTNLYSYVLTIEEKELEENSEFIPYKIIKIDVGTLKDEDKGIYTLSTSSPIYINPDYKEAFKMDFVGQNYFLFSSSNQLFNEEFQVELVLINEVEFDGDDYPETFRLIHTSRRGNQGHTLFTD